jgi:UDP-2,3-diacylglucosamine pyrophosphatase LpxH/biotin operon repressor
MGTMMENKEYQELKEIVLKKAKEYTDQKLNISWARIENTIRQLYPESDITREGIRAIYRRNYDEPYKETKNKYARQSQHRKKGLDTLQKVLKKSLRTKTSLQYLLDVLPVDTDTILAEIVRLELDGYEIEKWTEDGKRYLQYKTRRHDDSIQVNIQVNDQVKIAIISDLHIGHKRFEREFYTSFMDYAYGQGVKTVLVGGDIFEGHYQAIRPTSIKELNAIGYDEQFDLAMEVIKEYDGLHYYSISGNHDHSFERNAFADPVKNLARMRKDFTYIGHNYGKFIINNKIDIALVHPTDGIAQNYGLKMHKFFERAGKDKQARIVLMGHYHKHTHLHYRGQDGFILPSFVSQSQFMKDNDLASVVGGIILTLNLDKKGELVSLIPEYVFKK